MNTPNLAFVDIETTGGSAAHDRIIEIAVVRVENDSVVRTFETLLNPGVYLSPFIEQMTGIRQRDLEGAPEFREIKDQLMEVLDGCVFVAHNVRFDYGFIRNEMRRIGETYASKHLCTVKLSRMLFPEYHSHSLDRIIERFGISCASRHRAMGDAQVLVAFMNRLRDTIAAETLQDVIERAMKRPYTPSGLNPETIDALPDNPGVYIFYGEGMTPLYVGKSINIRERVLSHFADDEHSMKEMNISNQLLKIDTVTTAGEMGALLRESQLVKDLQPIYNRRLRLSRQMTVLRQVADPDGYSCARIEDLDAITPEQAETILGIFRGRRQAKEFLNSIIKPYGLCEYKLGLTSSRPCFSHKLEWCRGACDGTDPAYSYNSRFDAAFEKKRIRVWPYAGPVVFQEANQFLGMKDTFIVDRWCLVAMISTGAEGESIQRYGYTFDYDVYSILKHFLMDEANDRRIRDLPREKLEQILEYGGEQAAAY